MITYRATLDVPAATVFQVSRWLGAHRTRHDARPWQRAATPYVQAMMVLRWFKEATDLRILARDAAVSIATAYRYLHEAIDVIAAHAPDLSDVLAEGLRLGWVFVCLDGTLIGSTRSAALSEAGHDVWYSGKHKPHGGNIQVLTCPTGYPEWVSDVEPGSTHDITAARHHALPALYPAAAQGLPTLTDKGYTGAGIGIIVPTKGHNRPRQPDPQHPDQRAPSTRRTRQRPAQTHLESTRTSHPRSLEDRRDHRRRPSSYSTFNDQPGEKTSLLRRAADNIAHVRLGRDLRQIRLLQAGQGCARPRLGDAVLGEDLDQASLPESLR